MIESGRKCWATVLSAAHSAVGDGVIEAVTLLVRVFEGVPVPVLEGELVVLAVAEGEEPSAMDDVGVAVTLGVRLAVGLLLQRQGEGEARQTRSRE